MRREPQTRDELRRAFPGIGVGRRGHNRVIVEEWHSLYATSFVAQAAAFMSANRVRDPRAVHVMGDRLPKMKLAEMYDKWVEDESIGRELRVVMFALGVDRPWNAVKVGLYKERLWLGAKLRIEDDYAEHYAYLAKASLVFETDRAKLKSLEPAFALDLGPMREATDGRGQWD